MRSLRIAIVALTVIGAFAACKKGGGYIRTAPQPVLAP